MTTHNHHLSHFTLIVGRLLHGRRSFFLDLKRSAVNHEDFHYPLHSWPIIIIVVEKNCSANNDIVLMLVRRKVLEHILFRFRSNGWTKGPDDKSQNFNIAVYDKTQLQRKCLSLFFHNVLTRRLFFFMKSVYIISWIRYFYRTLHIK